MVEDVYVRCIECALKRPIAHAEPWQCVDCGLWWAVPMPGVRVVGFGISPAPPAVMTPEREAAIELLLCAADLCSMSLAVVEFADNAHALRTARQAWLAVDGWMIDEHGDVREWERAVVLEAAGLLLDGWNPGDKVVLR